MVLQPKVQAIWPFSLHFGLCAHLQQVFHLAYQKPALWKFSKRLNRLLESLNDNSILQMSFSQRQRLVQ